MEAGVGCTVAYALIGLVSRMTLDVGPDPL